MKISEVINMLEHFKKQHGDLRIAKDAGIKELRLIEINGLTTVDEDGCYNSKNPKFVEVF